MPHENLYIADNNGENRSVRKYLRQWCDISKQMDIATGYMEIGGLLDLDEDWQKLEKIRIILGSEMTKRTKEVIDTVVQYLISHLQESVDDEQDPVYEFQAFPALYRDVIFRVDLLLGGNAVKANDTLFHALHLLMKDSIRTADWLWYFQCQRACCP